MPESVPWFDHGPPAVQLVALVELQVRVERPAYWTGFGLAVSEAVGAGLFSEQETEEPLFEPWQSQVQVEVPLTLFMLVPGSHSYWGVEQAALTVVPQVPVVSFQALPAAQLAVPVL